MGVWGPGIQLSFLHHSSHALFPHDRCSLFLGHLLPSYPLAAFLRQMDH